MLVRVFRRDDLQDAEGQIFTTDDYDIVVLLNEDQKEAIRKMSKNECKIASGHHEDDEIFYDMLDTAGYFEAKCEQCEKEFMRGESPTQFCAKCFSSLKKKEAH